MKSRDHRIELLEPRRLLASIYGPDVSFAEGGHAYVPTTGFFVDFLPDGKILAAGTRQDPTYGEDLLLITTVTRLNSDGTSDTTFGPSGIRDDGNESNDGILSADKNRYYLEFDGYNYAEEIRAFDTGGQLDTAFSDDGVMQVPSKFALNDDYDDVRGHFIAATPDGGLLLDVEHEFYVENDYANSPRYRELIKLKSNGDVDSAFGDGGYIVFDLKDPSVDADFGIFWTTSGIFRYEPVAEGATNLTITRYHHDGKTIDTSFGNAGAITLDNPFADQVEQPDGKLLIVTKLHDTGQSGSKFRMTRYNVNGSIDSSFGSAGSVVMANPDFRDPYSGDDSDAYAPAVATIDNQSRIVAVAGDKLFRFSPTGTLDGFPFDGTQPLAGAFQFLTDDQGRVLASSGYGLTRYDVQNDIELGRNGVVYATAPDFSSLYADVAITSRAADSITINFNDEVVNFPAADVTGFNFTLGGGENVVDSQLELPVTISSGDEHDVFNTGDGADSINSKGGGDVITCGDGDDTIRVGKYENTTEGHTVIGGDGNKNIEVGGGALFCTLGVGNSRIRTAYEDGHSAIDIAGGSNDVSLNGDHDKLTIGGNGNNHVEFGGIGGHDVTTGGGDDSFQTYTSGTIRSGGGDDYFDVTALFDEPNPLIVFAGAGDDRLVIPWNSSTYDYHVIAHGQDGDDRLLGGNGAQYFYGEAGNDTLRGGDGSDLLCGGGGNDRLFGDGGNDRIYARAGRDYLNGGGGDDRLFGDGERDILYGAAGNDSLDGGATGDLLYGQAGGDNLTGGGGNDRLSGGDNADTLHGNAGDDTFLAVDTLVDKLFGDSGSDLSFADPSDTQTSIESSDHQLPPTPPPAPLGLTATTGELVIPLLGYTDADMAANGDYLVAAAAEKTVTAIRYSAAGEQIGDALTIATNPAGDDTQFANISVSTDAVGDSVIMYRITEGAPYYAAKSIIHFVLVSRTGVVSEPVLVAEGIVGAPSVSMARNGSFFATWLNIDPGYSESVLVRAFAADGAPVAPAFPIPEASGEFLSIAARPDGLAAVAVFAEPGDYSRTARFARVTRTGPRGSTGSINLDEQQNSISTDNPVVAVQPDGSFVIAYEQSETAFVQRYDADGHARGVRQALLPPEPPTANPVGIHSLAIDILPDGGFLAAFRQWNGNTAKETAYVRRFGATGVTDDAALLPISSHSTNSSGFEIASLATDGSGNAIILYTSEQVLLRRLKAS